MLFVVYVVCLTRIAGFFNPCAEKSHFSGHASVFYGKFYPISLLGFNKNAGSFVGFSKTGHFGGIFRTIQAAQQRGKIIMPILN